MNTKQMEAIISSIRDLLRKEGITGIDSINHCIVFVISRILNIEMCLKFGIDQKYAFSNLLKDENGDDIGDQDLYDRVYNHQKNCLVGQIMYVLGFMNMKFKLAGIHNLRLIYDKLSQFDVDKLSVKYDVIGTIYEIHLKSGTSNSMRDLGQYYTHRQVIQYMINLCDPQMKNGLIEKIVDPTMGTGGFLTMSIKYLNEKYENQIDWVKNKDHIIGFDIDENVRNMALLNVFLKTMELCKETLVKQDTLHNDMKFPHDDTILEKADVILANEPMGLKNIVHAECCERIKEMKIRGTKAEPLFLQLFMSALNDGGRCAVIVPDGVLFNESTLHTGTRKYLVENFNLKKVISLNDDFFINTGVKTSILFFKKDGQQTHEVEFSQICLKDEQIVETSVVTVSYQQINDSKYTLFVNKYNAEKVDKIVDMEYKKLGDICQFLPKSKRPASYGQEVGQYPFYTSSQKVKRCDEVDYHDECLIIGTGGDANIKIDQKFSCSADNFIVKLQTSSINLKYIYHYLRNNMRILEDGFSGSTIKHISKNFVEQIEFPIPTLPVQQAIVERLDVLSRNNETSQQMIKEYHQIMKYYMDCQTRNMGIMKMEQAYDILSSHKISKNIQDVGRYDFYNGSAQSPIGKSDEYSCDHEKPYILIIKDGGAGQGKYGDQIGLGKVFYVVNKTVFTSSVVALISKKDTQLVTKYVFYYLHTIKNNLMDMANYTTGLGHLTITKLKQVDILVPPIEAQHKIVEYCDRLSQMVDQMERQIDENTILMKQIMDNYLNQTQVNMMIQGNDEIKPIENQVSTTDEIPKKSPIINPSTADVSHDTNDLVKLTLVRLREIAKEKGLSGYSKLKKSDLIDLIAPK
jgi:type I restriction-modification system DNA methylase subunit